MKGFTKESKAPGRESDRAPVCTVKTFAMVFYSRTAPVLAEVTSFAYLAR